MSTLTIRNLDPEVVARLKERASSNRRSLEAELREILGAASRQPRIKDYRAWAEDIAAVTPPGPQTDSVVLLREDRER